MRWKPYLLYLLAALLLAPGSAATARSVSQGNFAGHPGAVDTQETHGNLTRAVLRGGLTVLVEEQPMYPLASIVTHVRIGDTVGDAEEWAKSRLLACLLESSEPARQTRRLGADFSVRTGEGWMQVVVTGPSENVARLLEVQARLLEPLELDSSLLPAARRRALEGTGPQGLTPSEAARERLLELALPDYRSRLLREDLEPYLEAVEVSELRRYHGAHFRKPRTALSVTGSVLTEHVMERTVRSYEEGKERASPEAVRRTEGRGNASDGFRYRHLRGEFFQQDLLLAWNVPSIDQEDHLPLRVLTHILGGGRGSFLHRTLVEEKEAALSVTAELHSTSNESVFMIHVRPEEGRIDAALAEALASIEVLGEMGVDGPQLDRAKSLFVRDHYRSLETYPQRAVSHALQETGGRTEAGRRVLSEVEKLTPARIQGVLRTHLDRSRVAVLEQYPLEMPPRTFTPEALVETLDVLVPAAAARLKEDIEAERLMERAPRFRLPDFTPRYQKHEWRRSSILRGPEIYFQEDLSAPLVHLGLFFPGGRITEPREFRGITEVMLESLLEPFEREDRPSGRQDQDWFGGEVEIVNEPDFFGFRATVLVDRFDELFESLMGRLRRPAPEAEAFERARRKVLSRLREAEESPEPGLSRSLSSRVYGEHPYSRGRFGTRRTLDELSPQLVEEWFSSQVEDVHPLVVIRGAIRGTAFLQGFVSGLSDSRIRYRSPVERRVPEELSSEILAKGGLRAGENGRLWMALSGPSRGGRDDATMAVLESLMGGPDGWLTEALREKFPGLERIDFRREARVNGGVILAILHLSGPEEEQLLQGFRKAVGRLAELGPTRPELMNALVRTIARAYLLQQDVDGDMVALVENVLAGRSLEEMADLIPMIRETDNPEVRFVVGRYFPSDESRD